MTDLSDLTAATAVADTDLVYLAVDAGGGSFNPRKITYADLKAALAADIGGAGGGGQVDLSAGVPAVSNFTWQNQNSASAADSATSGRAIILTAGGNSTSDDINALKKAVPGSTPYRIAVLLEGRTVLDGAFGDFGVIGWTDGTKLHGLRFGSNNDGSAVGLAVSRYSDMTTWVSNDYQKRSFINGPIVAGLYHDGTNVNFQVSASGADDTWETLYSVAAASGYLSSYSHAFFSVNRRTGDAITRRVVLRLWDESGLSRPFA